MIALVEKELRHRSKEITSMLISLVPKKPGIEVRQLGGGSDFVVGVLGKGVQPKSIQTPDAVRVPTTRSGVFLNYHERWKPVPKMDSYHLDRAYFHLYVSSNDGADTQILCFHCEPTAGATGPSAPYKNGPHLHIGGATPNIMKSHISVCIGDSAMGGTDIVGLSKTLKETIKMIELELLPRY